MPLLLAIEPDARQAACLTALVSAHLTAELALTTSVEEALAALQQRQPDLVLTSSSLSADDQAELMARLGAGHPHEPGVPTLTIPALAGLPPSLGTRGLLARLRRPRTWRRPQACDPASFAAQITECLALASAVRRACADATSSDRPDAAPLRPESDVSAAAIDLQVFVEPERADEPVVDAAWLDLEPFLDDEARPAGHPPTQAADGVADADVIELPAPDELWAQLAPGYAGRMAPLEGPSMTPRSARAAAHERTTALDTTEAEDAALRLVRVAPGADRPTQDEWGLYDPEQCGFAALRLRLDELANDDRRERERDNRSAIMRP
jgi:hypothetical protein